MFFKHILLLLINSNYVGRELYFSAIYTVEANRLKHRLPFLSLLKMKVHLKFGKFSHLIF